MSIGSIARDDSCEKIEYCLTPWLYRNPPDAGKSAVVLKGTKHDSVAYDQRGKGPKEFKPAKPDMGRRCRGSRWPPSESCAPRRFCVRGRADRRGLSSFAPLLLRGAVNGVKAPVKAVSPSSCRPVRAFQPAADPRSRRAFKTIQSDTRERPGRPITGRLPSPAAILAAVVRPSALSFTHRVL